ncbi:MAG: hypothetical protein PHU12_04350 [Candidatus Aenigmarchaeota archaeon]|nr:hypothetical protein [Candidatus Aenigmarchaeota archaeon]
MLTVQEKRERLKSYCAGLHVTEGPDNTCVDVKTGKECKITRLSVNNPIGSSGYACRFDEANESFINEAYRRTFGESA